MITLTQKIRCPMVDFHLIDNKNSKDKIGLEVPETGVEVFVLFDGNGDPKKITCPLYTFIKEEGDYRCYLNKEEGKEVELGCCIYQRNRWKSLE